MDSYSAFKISGSVVVWSPNKVGAFVFSIYIRRRCRGLFLVSVAPEETMCLCTIPWWKSDAFFFLGNVVHVLLWFFSSVLQNNTLTFKHITCFQLHNASKLFSASFVAVPFSQYCCGEAVWNLNGSGLALGVQKSTSPSCHICTSSSSISQILTAQLHVFDWLTAQLAKPH